ncbi:MAG TPA: M28 family peptidase [Actinomycetes bacterium]|nr:M28 family peptidase [Actinomycetes bacterium]
MNAPDPVERWLDDVRALADDIGPRGPTTEGERRGHQYCEEQLRGAGLQPVREEFVSARSIFLPHLIAACAMLAAFAVYPLAGRPSAVVAASLSLFTVLNEVLELGYRPNLLRRVLPMAPSQNVHAVVDPVGERLRDVVVVGHVDTQRTPVVFRSPGWVRVYAVSSLVVFLAFAGQLALQVAGAVSQWPWVWPATFPSAVAALGLAVLCIEADRSPFTVGANDNASAVGLVLELARRYQAAPLAHTRLWALCSGCEEVQHYGMADFLRRHAPELRDPVVIPFELVGVAGPAYLTLEGIVVPFRADATLVELCSRLATEHPEWDTYPVRITGGNTEMADAVRAGIPSIAIVGITKDLVGPYWHQRQDTADNMNPEAMGRTFAMVTTLIDSLDPV